MAIRYKGVILGAYCGNVACTPAEDTLKALDALFGYAQKHALPVNMHIDETSNPDCCCMQYVVTSLEKARKELGYEEDVVLGHCTSLALQTEFIKKK